MCPAARRRHRASGSRPKLDYVLEMFPPASHNWRMDMPATPQPRKGRGAGSNETGRFESEKRIAFDDGWSSSEEEPARLPTTLSVDTTRTIIARNDSPDIGFDRSINPYRGCEHGCIYCYARPSHAYLGLSPGLDFESRLFYKPDAAALLAEELRKKGYICRPIAFGSNTDPYQPVARRRRHIGRLYPVAPAARTKVPLQGMARGAFPGQGGSRALARRANPRRPALRFDLV